MRNYDSLLQPLIGGGLLRVRYVFLLGLYYVRFVLRGLYYCYLYFWLYLSYRLDRLVLQGS